MLAVQGHLFIYYYSRVVLHQTNVRAEVGVGIPYLLIQSLFFLGFLRVWNFGGWVWRGQPGLLRGWVLLNVVGSVGLLGWDLEWRLRTRQKVRVHTLGSRTVPGNFPLPLEVLQRVGLRNQLHDLQVRELEIFLPNWPKEWSGLTLVHLTDLHHGRYIPDGYLAQVRSETLRLKPDLVVLTGDFVSTPNDLPFAFGWMRGIRAKMGAFAVLGNHDGWTDIPGTERGLRRAGIRVLKNEGVLFHRGRSRLALLGAEDLWTGNPDTSRLRTVRAEARILLAHHPDHFYLAQLLKAQLQLSGHCHGGQVCLPGGRAIVAPSRFGTRYASGFFREGPSVMFVNRGVGAYPPIRLYCPPEIVKLTLRSETN